MDLSEIANIFLAYITYIYNYTCSCLCPFCIFTCGLPRPFSNGRVKPEHLAQHISLFSSEGSRAPVSKKKHRRTSLFGDTPQEEKETRVGKFRTQHSQETVNIVKWMKQHLTSERTGWWRETSGVHQPLVLKSSPWHIRLSMLVCGEVGSSISEAANHDQTGCNCWKNWNSMQETAFCFSLS